MAMAARTYGALRHYDAGMEELLESAPSSPALAGAVDAAAFVLSRLPRAGTASAFVDAATSATLSFLALRRGALSLASGLRRGLGLRRGDAVLVLSHNSLLLPQILLGVLAAGAVVVVLADPDATPSEVAAAAHSSGAAIVVAAPEAAAKVAGIGVPLLLTSRSPDPRTLSAEELIDGADPLELEELASATPEGRPRPSDVAFLAYPSAGRTAAAVMTHADLVAAMCGAAALGLPRHDGDPRRVCLASIPMCSAQGLPLLALGLPAAEATTVLVPPTSDPRAAVAAHAATDVVAAPEVAAPLAGPVPHDGRLSSLRRVVVVAATTPLTTEAREEFRRRLPWVQHTQLLPGVPENQTEEMASEHVQVAPGPALLGTQTPVMQHNDTLPADQMSETNEAASTVPPLKKIQKIILGDIFSRSTTSKILRKHPVTGNRQAASKL